LNRQFSKEEVQIANKYMKKCLTSLAIKQMHIKTTLRFHLISVRMAISRKQVTRHWERYGGKGKGILNTLLVRIQPLWI
jgi:hypothetical protein